MDLFYEIESIYSRIEKVIKDKGYVPYDFVLEPKKQTEDKITFAEQAELSNNKPAVPTNKPAATGDRAPESAAVT